VWLELVEGSSIIVMMQVENGVRFELRLAEENGESASFRLLVRVPGGEFVGQAEISGTSGAIRLQFADSSEPPEWCLNVVRSSLRTLFRERSARGGYPARVARWRPAPTNSDGESS
jgi:hypothetical protein